MMSHRDRVTALLGKIVKFGVAGAIAAIAALATSLALYRVAAVNYAVSQAVGFIVGAAINYPINRRWTFRNGYSNVVTQFLVFLAVAASGLLVNEAALYELASVEHLWVPLGMVGGIVVAFVWNFALHTLVTFGKFS